MKWSKNELTKMCLTLDIYEEKEISLKQIYTAIKGKNKSVTDYLLILQSFFVSLGCCYKINGDNILIMRFMSLN